MEGSQHYPLPTAVNLLYCADNEAAAYVRWSAMAGAFIRQAGEVYTILEPGRRNTGAGPDFLRARIRFPDGSTRAGDIEIHCRTAGWRQHGHRWDRRYSNVILHVITGGAAAPIKLGMNQKVPTVCLASQLPVNKPCETNSTAHPGSERIEQMIPLLAAQRWYRRLARFTAIDPARQQLELALRLTCGSAAEQLVQLWRGELQIGTDLVGFIERVLDRARGQKWGGQKFTGRLSAGSALVWHHRYATDNLWALTFADIWAMINELAAADLPVPTQQFVIELVGNWVLPLSQLASGRDCFDDWYNLPRGWLYGRVRTFMPSIERAAPKLFGEQQGLLEWLESLCDGNSCTACPLVNSQL